MMLRMTRTHSMEKIIPIRTRSTSTFTMNTIVTSESSKCSSELSSIILNIPFQNFKSVLTHQVPPTEWDEHHWVGVTPVCPGHNVLARVDSYVWIPRTLRLYDSWWVVCSWISQLYISVRSGAYLSLYEFYNGSVIKFLLKTEAKAWPL